MSKFIRFLSIMMVVVLISASAAACADKSQNGLTEDKVTVALDCTDIVLKIGETRTLNATVSSEKGKTYQNVWASDDNSIATVSSSGLITAVNSGSAVISVTAGRSSDYCQVTVTKQGNVSVDDEKKVPGYIYHEDFNERTAVPGYLRKNVSGGGDISINNQEMTFSTTGTGMAFASYVFDETLSGKIIAETRVKVGSTSFSNILFFYRGEAGYDNNDIIACLGMDAGGFKNHNGNGWSAFITRYNVNTWYEIKMILDIGAGKYALYINGTQYADQTFRKRGDGIEDRIKLLKFGTDKANATLTYDYIKIRGDYSPTIAADETTYSLALDKSKSTSLKYSVSGTPKPSVTVTTDCGFATISSDKRTITFADDTPDGAYNFVVKAENEHGYQEKTFTVLVRGDSNILLNTDFASLPGGMTISSANGSTEVRNDSLVISTNGSGSVSAFARYNFGEILTGKVQAETKIKINSSAFLNVLFLYRAGATTNTATLCTSSLAIEKNKLKYHNGSDWITLSDAGTITNNVYYEIKVVYDFDNYTMSVWLNDNLVLENGKMRRAENDTAVLVMGSDKVNAYIEYDYLKFTKVGSEE